MCKAFSCIVDPAGKVTWKLGVDSHSDLAILGGYKDRTLGEFGKIEITPDNGDYLNPSGWTLRVDESPAPSWLGMKEKEACLAAHKKWLKLLDKFIVRQPIVHPFTLTPPSKITKVHVDLLRKWASVWSSVRASVRASVWDSVRASVYGYIGSFFRIPVWSYVKHSKGKYPYQSLVDLWITGLVPSFDGTTWRLHGGPKAAILFKITATELQSRTNEHFEGV
jgi:hypothetical protein